MNGSCSARGDRDRRNGALLSAGQQRNGTPVEPRNFTRELDRRCERAGVRRIRVHDTRHTCASLPAALDAHPRIAMQILCPARPGGTFVIIAAESLPELPEGPPGVRRGDVRVFGGDRLTPHCDSRVYNPVRMPAVCKAPGGCAFGAFP